MVTEEVKLERRHLKEQEREGREGEREGVKEERVGEKEINSLQRKTMLPYQGILTARDGSVQLTSLPS
jgi:hypothetical protein